MSDVIPRIWRTVFRAIAIYAAGAWAIVEVVDFAVRSYGLSRFLVDAAVLVAFGGGMVTAVLVWFHGESGPQKPTVPEIAILSSIAIATFGGLLLVAGGGQTKEFDDLQGYRLVLEYRQISYKGGEEDMLAFLGPFETTVMFDDGMFNLSPQDGSVRAPVLRIKVDGHPTMFADSPDSDLLLMIFVLPYQPSDLTDLIEIGTNHDSATIKTPGLQIDIDTGIEIVQQENGATIRINKTAGISSGKQ